MASIAGTFDASEHPRFRVPLYTGSMTSSISIEPRVGNVILVVLLLGDRDTIASDFCTFMPDRDEVINVNGVKVFQTARASALVEIKGLGDPRVLETLKRIQEARAHPDPDPYGSPKTRPSTQATTRPTDRK
jgi:hypothetical protein